MAMRISACLRRYAPWIIDEFLWNGALFQVTDIVPFPFQNYLGMTTATVENGILESGIVTTTESERCQKRICPSPEDGGPSWRMFERAPKAPAARPRGLCVPMSVAGTKRTTPGRLPFVRFRGKSVKRRTGREAAMAAFAKSWRRE